MKKLATLFVLLPIMFAVFAVPVTSIAQESQPSLIVCGDKLKADGTLDNACTFADVIKLADAIMKFILYISIPVSAGLFIYAGFLYVTAGPNTGQAEKAKDIFKTVAIGFVIILSAWVIVYTIVNGLTSGSDSGENYLKFLE